MPSPPDPACGPVRLPAHCSTAIAEDLRVQLVLAADLADTIVVDASEVESVGQAVLQLIVAARAEAERGGGALAIDPCSQAFAERVTRCGIGAAMGIPEDQRAQ